MLILGIETSCDETAAAVVQDGTKLLSNIVASSQEIHAKYGGIVPDQAAREQLRAILPVITEALGPRAWDQIDALAVTVGPGLIGSLLVGVETAKALAWATNKPLIPVNHLAGHLYANWITGGTPSFPYPAARPTLPALALLVSGGHSDLILVRTHRNYVHLGGTRDDAAGECFDKCGRLLGLPYPYGPFIGNFARRHHGQDDLRLPRPLLHLKNYDFSFSGLKTAFSQLVQKMSPLKPTTQALLAYHLEEAITDCLVAKTLLALRHYPVPSLILAGGVAANSRLREKMKSGIQKLTVNLFVPPQKLCTDNAAYIASAAFYRPESCPIMSIQAQPGLTIID